MPTCMSMIAHLVAIGSLLTAEDCVEDDSDGQEKARSSGGHSRERRHHSRPTCKKLRNK